MLYDKRNNTVGYGILTEYWPWTTTYIPALDRVPAPEILENITRRMYVFKLCVMLVIWKVADTVADSFLNWIDKPLDNASKLLHF